MLYEAAFGSAWLLSIRTAACASSDLLHGALLQEYVNHDCDTSEMGASRFAARDVHRIGILDIRIWNTDRHAGNILVRRRRESSLGLSGLAKLDFSQLELVPIDHGFCLPESLEPPYFEWLHWPQVHSLTYTCRAQVSDFGAL